MVKAFRNGQGLTYGDAYLGLSSGRSASQHRIGCLSYPSRPLQHGCSRRFVPEAGESPTDWFVQNSWSRERDGAYSAPTTGAGSPHRFGGKHGARCGVLRATVGHSSDHHCSRYSSSNQDTRGGTDGWARYSSSLRRMVANLRDPLLPWHRRYL